MCLLYNNSLIVSSEIFPSIWMFPFCVSWKNDRSPSFTTSYSSIPVESSIFHAYIPIMSFVSNQLVLSSLSVKDPVEIDELFNLSHTSLLSNVCSTAPQTASCNAFKSSGSNQINLILDSNVYLISTIAFRIRCAILVPKSSIFF